MNFDQEGVLMLKKPLQIRSDEPCTSSSCRTISHNMVRISTRITHIWPPSAMSRMRLTTLVTSLQRWSYLTIVSTILGARCSQALTWSKISILIKPRYLKLWGCTSRWINWAPRKLCSEASSWVFVRTCGSSPLTLTPIMISVCPLLLLVLL